MEEKLICQHCGAEITNKLGAEVKADGYYDRDGVYYDQEFRDTNEFYCVECGQTLPEEIANKFFGEEE